MAHFYYFWLQRALCYALCSIFIQKKKWKMITLSMTTVHFERKTSSKTYFISFEQFVSLFCSNFIKSALALMSYKINVDSFSLGTKRMFVYLFVDNVNLTNTIAFIYWKYSYQFCLWFCAFLAITFAVPNCWSCIHVSW